MLHALCIAILIMTFIIYHKLTHDVGTELIRSAAYYTRKLDARNSKYPVNIKITRLTVIINTLNGNSYFFEHPSLGFECAGVRKVDVKDYWDWTKKYDI